MQPILDLIAKELHINIKQIEQTLALLEEGNTVAFIARYRKEMTQGLDEEQIHTIQEQYTYQVKLAQRKEDVLRLIEQQGKLDDEIRIAIHRCEKLSQVEDIYRPYQQKRKTRATDAIEKGLEPLAKWLLSAPETLHIENEVQRYLNEKVATIEDALQGAKDIIAEMVSECLPVRSCIRKSIEQYGKIMTKEKKNHNDERKVYKMYYDYHERVSTLAPHRIMAIDRGEKEKVLSVSFSYDKEYVMKWTNKRFLKTSSPCIVSIIEEAVTDGLKRLAFPSIEREIRKELSEKAQEQSIAIFSLNVERLLLQPPMKNKRILGFDPAYRTGCKLAVIDSMGKLLHVDVIYPHQPNAKVKEAKEKLLFLCTQYAIDIIAIGNGTASRESEQFVAQFIKEYHLALNYTMVSEAGASVYSASALARKEFPDLQVEQRSAISIARRMIDPLAELIKIDPQSIGVGQYQHDLASNQLKERLAFVVFKVVNRVGVNLNTASVELLKHISGLTSATAKAIVDYRESHGAFMHRFQLKDVPKIGEKAFQQAAGFLRIEDGSEKLDQTAIHPESYELAKKVLQALKLQPQDMGSKKAIEIIQQCPLEDLSRQFACDPYTLQDILDHIAQPLRDYRDQYNGPLLRSDVLTLEDLHIGDQLEGVVRNVVDFGAFVDIGLKEDGLIHISKMSEQRVEHPSQIVSIGDIVRVWVAYIDEEKQKVQLSLFAVP